MSQTPNCTHSSFIFLQKNSLLEHHHIHATHGILTETGLLQHLTEEDRREVLELMDELILATDISCHREFASLFERQLKSGIDLSKREHRRLVLQVNTL